MLVSFPSKVIFYLDFDLFKKNKKTFRLLKIREEKMNQMFPDEIDTPFETPARTRFGRWVLTSMEILLKHWI